MIRILVVLAVAVGGGCVSAAPGHLLDRTQRFDDPVSLPAPDIVGTTPFETVLQDRRSARSFSSAPLPRDAIGQLFWSAQGITGGNDYRTAPSAGARYPLEVYAVAANEVVHYVPDGHRIERRSDTGAKPGIAELAFGQQFVSEAPIVFVIAADVARTEVEYGAVADTLVDRETGHAAQNLLLQAEALGLDAVPVGGFDAAAVADLLLLPPAEQVAYLIPVGRSPEP